MKSHGRKNIMAGNSFYLLDINKCIVKFAPLLFLKQRSKEFTIISEFFVISAFYRNYRIYRILHHHQSWDLALFGYDGNEDTLPAH